MNKIPTASKCDEQCEHLVHLCHTYLKPSCLQVQVQAQAPAPAPAVPGKSSATPGEYRRFRRATEYYEAGVKFRRWYDADAGAGANRPLLDVSFSNGVLRMAQHTVDDKTNYILRNVLAYEQCYRWSATSRDTSYVAAYVVFMSQLLSTPEDVALLSRRGVIEHMLGNDADVCAMFRGIADGVVFDPASEHYLMPIGVALQAHYKSRFHRWRAWVMRHRFGNPWLAAAWVFGAMAVLGTIVQTVLAVLSYVNQAPTHKVLGPGI
ncbi:UPF0481 protein At3g47200 [Aegilops tauschii subsp. strangulata]|nr:UPF0481 protein At3g47200 [Aegilops tauschii subsp. strangulata]